MLKLAREEAVLARDHRRGRQAARDLLRHVRPGEHRDAAAAHARREPLARRRVESFRQAQHRRVAGQGGDDVRERRARHGDDNRVDVARRVVERNRLDAAEVGAGEIARIVSRLGDRSRLLGGVAREHDVVVAVEQHT